MNRTAPATILLVEDDPADQKLVKMSLRNSEITNDILTNFWSARSSSTSSIVSGSFLYTLSIASLMSSYRFGFGLT